METIGSKRSYALTWCMPNNDDDDDDIVSKLASFLSHSVYRSATRCLITALELRTLQALKLSLKTHLGTFRKYLKTYLFSLSF